MNPPPVPKLSAEKPLPVPVPKLSAAPSPPPAPASPRSAYGTMVEQGRASIMSGSVRSGKNNERQPLCNGTLVGQYLIVSLMGVGGFGLTYLAIDQRTNAQVVLKEHMPIGIAIRDAGGIFVTTPTQEAEDTFQATLDEFRDEINIIIALEHPGIVRIVDAFEANGTAYYVMPLVKGVHLDITKRAEMDKGLRSREARRVRLQLIALLNALAYLDQNQVVHRDLKPENILITPEGHPILLDFGSARQIRPGKDYSNVYTPAFCAPEQAASSHDPKWGKMEMGPWTDLYSLAACFYYCITRMLPPSAETRIFSYPNDPYRPLAKRADLQDVYGDTFLAAIDQALALDVADRWQHAKNWLTYLEKGTRTEKTWRLRNIIPYTIAAALAVGCTCSLCWNLQLREENRRLYEGSVNFSSNLLTDLYPDMTDMPGSSPIQEKFCQYLGDYLESMEDSGVQHGNAYRENSAIAHLNIGRYHANHGNLSQAMTNLKQAENDISPICVAVDADHQYQYILGGILIQQARVLCATGKDEEAEEVVKNAIDLMRRLCRAVPKSPDYVGLLCGALMLDATIKHDDGQSDAATTALDEVLRRIETNLSVFAKHQVSLQCKADALHLKGLIALDRSDPDSAAELFRQELELYTQLLEKSKYRISYLEGQARAMYFSGIVYTYRAAFAEDGRSLRDKALEIFKQHFEKCQKLERLDAGRPSFMNAECRSLSAIQSIMQKNGQLNMSEAYATKLMRKAKLLHQVSPDNVDHSRMYAEAWLAMATVHRNVDQSLSQAARELDECRRLLDKLLLIAPANYNLLNTKVKALEESARLYHRMGDCESAAAYLKQASSVVLVLRKAYPRNDFYALMLRRLTALSDQFAK